MDIAIGNPTIQHNLRLIANKNHVAGSLKLIAGTLIPAVVVGFGLAHLLGIPKGQEIIVQTAAQATALSALSGLVVVSYYAIRTSRMGVLIYGALFTAMTAFASAFLIG